MSADGRYGIGMRCLVPAPSPFDRLRLRPEAQPEGAGLSSYAGEPALSLSKRGDQSHARGRSNDVLSALKPRRGRAREGAALPEMPHGHRGGVRPAYGA